MYNPMMDESQQQLEIPQQQTLLASAFNMQPLQATLSATADDATTPFNENLKFGSAFFMSMSVQASSGGPAQNEEFPILGAEPYISSKKQRKKPLKKEEKPKEPEDPCRGKPKEFFIQELDSVSKAPLCNIEQSVFVATYYPEHYFMPKDILEWLYDMAEYRDACEEAKNQGIYNVAPEGQPTIPGDKWDSYQRQHAKRKDHVEHNDDDSEEESLLGFPKNYKEMQNMKKKTSAAHSRRADQYQKKR